MDSLCPQGWGDRCGSTVGTTGRRTGAAWLLGGGSAGEFRTRTDGWRGRRAPGRRGWGRGPSSRCPSPFPPPGPRGRYGGVCSAPGAGMAVPGAGSGAIPGAGRPRASRPAPLHVTRRGGCERWGPAPLCSGTGTDPAPRRSAPAAPGKRRAAAPGAAPTVGVTGAAQQRGGPGRTRDLQPLPVPGGGWGGGLGVGDVSPYVSPSPPSMYPTNSLPPFTPKPAPPPFPPPSRPHIPPPPHPYPCNLPSLPPISGLAPRLGVPPPPLTSRTAPCVGEGGVHPAGFARGGGGALFARGCWDGLRCAGGPRRCPWCCPAPLPPARRGRPSGVGGGGTRTVGEGAVMVWGPPAARHPQGAAPSTPSPPGSATMDHPGPPSAS